VGHPKNSILKLFLVSIRWIPPSLTKVIFDFDCTIELPPDRLDERIVLFSCKDSIVCTFQPALFSSEPKSGKVLYVKGLKYKMQKLSHLIEPTDDDLPLP
jgi:hypothetical protein